MNKNTIKWTTSAAALTAFGLLAAPMANAVTVLTLEPLQFGQGPVIAKQLQGSMCSGDNVCKSVKYPASLSPTSIPTGAAALNKMINAESGPVIVFGYSEGAQVAGKWMQQYGTGPNAPDPSKVSFVLIGDPNRKYGGVDYQLAQKLHISIPTDTQYQVTDIARQYDFWADTPAKLTDAFVRKNAIAGSMFVHTDYTQVNPNDPRNVKFTEGNITYVTVPNDVLPVYQLMANQGQMAKALQLTAQNRAKLEAAYNRPVPIPVYNAPATAGTTTPTVTTPTKPVTTKPANPIKAAVQDLKAKIQAAVAAHKAQAKPAAAGAAKASANKGADVPKAKTHQGKTAK